MINSADSFSTDYDQARSKFRQAAGQAGGQIEAVQHPEKGPTGSDLFTDIARFGSPHAEKMLVLISGTHGVEAFCGSGAQVDFLRRGEVANLPEDVGLLMIHAINPYGFAWLRRVTHENVDLNRNWIDFTKPVPDNAGYTVLNPVLCPAEWSEATPAMLEAALIDYGTREGLTALKQAISGGQYHDPAGIFYGGTSPSWSRITQTRIFEHYLGKMRAVGIIDYHSGLGPWGFGEQIMTTTPGAPAFERAKSWYGAALVSMMDGTSLSAQIAGDGLTAAGAILPNCTVTGMALEFGTRSRTEVRLALCADAWLHTHGNPESTKGREIKKQIKTALYGDTDDWKGMVAGQSLLVCRQALSGLAGQILLDKINA